MYIYWYFVYYNQQMTVSSKSESITSSMMKVLLLLCFVLMCTQKIPTMTYENIYHWSYVPDNIHRFIILNQPLLTLLQSSYLPQTSTIQYYTHDCNKNSTILRTCQSNPESKIIVIYNKVIIEFQNWRNQNIEETVGRVHRWIQNIAQGAAQKNMAEDKILNLITQKGEVFILVQNRTIHDLEKGYNCLAKQFYFKDFIYFSDLAQAQKLNLTIGNFLHIKSPHPLLTPLNLTLHQILTNPQMTTYFPQQTTKRYDILKAFVLQNIFTRGFDKRIQNIEHQRFDIKVRKLEDTGKYNVERNLIVFCDFGEECRRYLGLVDQQIVKNGMQMGTKIKRIFYRHEMVRNIQIMEIFFHIKIKNLRLPYVLVLSGEDPTISHLPLRFSKQFSVYSQKPLSQLTTYLSLIDNGKILNTYLSSGIPKKNGFTGKGSQKRVQKLSYETYKKQISQVLNQNKFYLLFISAFDFNCEQCSKFYTEYKKLASFLETQTNSNVVLGVFDLSKDQIDIKEMSGVPSVLFFGPKKGLYQPVQYERRYEFEDVLKFINDQKIKDSKVEEKKIEAEKPIEEPREVFTAVLTGQQL